MTTFEKYNDSYPGTIVICASIPETVSGRVIHKKFGADFCGYLLNKS
jgi:hypothetical protein